MLFCSTLWTGQTVLCFDRFSFKQPWLCLHFAHAREMLLMHGWRMFLTHVCLKRIYALCPSGLHFVPGKASAVLGKASA